MSLEIADVNRAACRVGTYLLIHLSVAGDVSVVDAVVLSNGRPPHFEQRAALPLMRSPHLAQKPMALLGGRRDKV